MDTKQLIQTLTDQGTRLGLELLGALALWIAGRWLINVTMRLVKAGMARQKVDSTLSGYAVSTLNGLLKVLLIVSVLGAFGIQTASFAAIFVAIGLAIGTAWGGLLSNFAAGVFMIVLRPFKEGDFIEAGGVTGTVVEIGPFVTRINTPDNVHTFVGNNKIFSDTIRNYSQNSYRRVELEMQLDHDANVGEIMLELKTRLAGIVNVSTTPSPDVEILELNLHGPKLAVRPYCNNTHYWQVYFDTNRIVRELAVEKGYSVPTQHLVVHNPA